MSVALLVITDGRDGELAATLDSAAENLCGPITQRWLVDDTGDDAHRAALAATYPDFQVIGQGPRRGFGATLAYAWAHLAAHTHAPFVFHLEDDFTFNRPVNLTAMAGVLTERDYLVQMALRRQPWSPEERTAGGVVQRFPTAYIDCIDGLGDAWLEHQMFFTTNPSLYRISLCAAGWPAGNASEGMFTHRLLLQGSPEVAGQALRFGYWGRRDDDPWVTHIGHQRTGTGY